MNYNELARRIDALEKRVADQQERLDKLEKPRKPKGKSK